MDGLTELRPTQDPDLRIDPSAMKERDYHNTADTDRYQVSILTAESGRLMQEGKEAQAKAMRQLVEEIFSGQAPVQERDAVLAQMESLDIFTSAERLKSVNAVSDRQGLPLPAIVGLFVILGLAGYGLGRLLHAHGRRKGNVYNDYGTAKQ